MCFFFVIFSVCFERVVVVCRSLAVLKGVYVGPFVWILKGVFLRASAIGGDRTRSLKVREVGKSFIPGENWCFSMFF